MRTLLRTLFNDTPGNTRAKVIAIYAILLVFNLGAWLWAIVAFHRFPVLLGTAFLAYSFGLRHAVDADHIAAIDNVTRKLMQEGKRPVTIGLFFSLGHSTVVFGLSAAIALGTAMLNSRFTQYKAIGVVFGTVLSASFLLAIAIGNFIILRSVYRTLRHVNSGGRYVEEEVDLMLSKRGFFGRVFKYVFRLVEKSWQMYFVGLLFGLGFDTATEVGLLGISATAANKNLPIWTILLFPLLFATGMALVDSIVSILMLSAYGWAFAKPVRKLYYNLTVTFASVIVALLVGLIEILGLIASQFNMRGRFWNIVVSLNSKFGVLGFLIVGFFALSLVISVIVYRIRRNGKIKLNPAFAD